MFLDNFRLPAGLRWSKSSLMSNRQLELMVTLICSRRAEVLRVDLLKSDALIFTFHSHGPALGILRASSLKGKSLNGP